MAMGECHIVLLPFPLFGHSIPMVDMAKLLASRGVKTTVIATQSFAHCFAKSIEQTINYTHQITLHILESPALNQTNFLDVISSHREPVEQFLEQCQPNCIIADTFSWATKVAAKFNIPRLIFDASGFFAKCVNEAIRLHKPEKTVSSDSEPFIVPHLPHEIMLTRKQIPNLEHERFKEVWELQRDVLEADLTSYGTIVNTFYELEPEYAGYFREVLKRRAWHIGPVSLCCKNAEDKLERGKKSVIDEHECSKWLDSKTPNSVIYISFGSTGNVGSSQLYEIAMGLEACNHDFIWVIRNDQETLLPEGFEARMRQKGKGLIVKGWAPQVLILDHVSVGGFMTHNGWNSTLEGVCGGVAMVTWPTSAEQFLNAKLVTDVLRIGVSIGDVEWSEISNIKGVKREAVEEAVERVMGAEEGNEMRRRAQVLKEKAKAAVEVGGSSYTDLTAFIEEMKAIKSGNGGGIVCGMDAV